MLKKYQESFTQRARRTCDTDGGAEAMVLCQFFTTFKLTTMRNIDEVSGAIVDTAIKIHKHLGPGLLESVYESVLARSLRERGLSVEQQKLISFDYAELHFIDAFRVDLIIEGQVLVELKSIEKLALVHHKQLLTYLRLTKLHVGLLLNFGEATLIEVLRRIVNNYVRLEDEESDVGESE